MKWSLVWSVVILCIMDTILTYYAIFGTTGFKELNPVARFFINNYGPIGFIIWGIIGVIGAGLIIYGLLKLRERPWKYRWVLTVMVWECMILSILPVANNIFLLVIR